MVGGGKTVFIGNIPFEVDDSALKAIFEQVGPIASLRVMRDNMNKPRGFAFCEYNDSSTAKSAIRNLNGHEIDGRALRVDSAEQDNSEKGKTVRRYCLGAVALFVRLRPC